VDAAVPPELVVRARNVGVAIVAPVVAVRLLRGPLLERFRFGVGQKLAAGELRGPLERRDRREIPDALQVGLSVGCTKRFRRLRAERCIRERDDHEAEGSTHGTSSDGPAEAGHYVRSG